MAVSEAADEKVKVELELPKDQVSVEPAEDDKPKASYEPRDVLKAAVEPPEPKAKAPPNRHQKLVMVFGFALVAASLLLWPLIGLTVFVAVAVTGAAVIAFGTLVRI